MKKLIIVLPLLMMIFGSATTAICQDSDKEEKVRAIQDRIYQKSHELGIAGGYIPDEDFYESFPVGAYYMFTFNEHFAWEVARAQWIFNNAKDLKNDLENDFGVRSTELSEPQYSICSHAVFTPFYGKDAVLNRGVINRETYFLLGGGIVHYNNKDNFENSSVAQNALNKVNRRQTEVMSQIHNTLGVSWLYLGEDELARDAFKQAIEQDDANTAARINLAGLYQYYGHAARAEKIYGKVTATRTESSINGRIHPRAGDMYYGNRKISKN